jgi:hypothetical protein
MLLGYDACRVQASKIARERCSCCLFGCLFLCLFGSGGDVAGLASVWVLSVVALPSWLRLHVLAR